MYIIYCQVIICYRLHNIINDSKTLIFRTDTKDKDVKIERFII